MTNTAPRTFSFVFDPAQLLASVPAEAFETKRAPTTANPLPFKDFFAPAAAAVNAALAEGKVTSVPLFVPFSYFVIDRKIAADKVDGPYVTGKVRDQFNEWRDETKIVTVAEVREPSTMKLDANGQPMKNKVGRPINIPGKVTTPEVATNPERGKFALTAITRNGSEINPITKEAYGEPGVSFWLILGEAERKAVEDAQKAAEEAKKPAKGK